jgi:limonene-1,2-epoxide hydrolase
MTEPAESVVRKFFATWPRSDVDEMVGFFTDDAVYIDGPRGTYRGIDAIKAELQSIVLLRYQFELLRATLDFVRHECRQVDWRNRLFLRPGAQAVAQQCSAKREFAWVAQ